MNDSIALIELKKNNEKQLKLKLKMLLNKITKFKKKIVLIVIILFIIIFSIINNTKKLKEKKGKGDEKNTDPYCDGFDPINMFNLRIKNGPKIICQNEESKHICYQNNDGYYNDVLWHKNGALCIMENIILDPSKAEKTSYIYKGPVDPEKQGFPRLSNGFFNMKCDNPNKLENVNKIYDTYFNSWNYDNKPKKGEKIEELAPNKTILFLSRNQDSPNLFHGNSEIINVISMMYLFNLNPENIQVIFLESLTIKDDPFYDIYKNVISRGGEPIYINDLKQKYHISSAIHVPINWDSPCFFTSEYPHDRYSIPNCQYPTQTYKLYNDLVDKYFNLIDFTDSFISDKEIFYYPESIIKNHKLKTKFNKAVTILWRKVWPKGRKGQKRLIGNGPELADKLASILPKNILIRLVDTASLPMNEQISILRKTDYLIGIHGAALSLSIFMPNKSIFHEIIHCPPLKVLQIMGALSGHKIYSDYIKSQVRIIEDSEYVFFNVDDFAKSVLDHMKENNYL